MEESIVNHINKDTKYRVSYEQAATKGIIGFKVEAHGDSYSEALLDANELLREAHNQAKIFSEQEENKKMPPVGKAE